MRCFRFVLAAVAVLMLSAPIFADVAVKAFLYNPKADSIILRYPYPRDVNQWATSPYLMIIATGAADGSYECEYAIERGSTVLKAGTFTVETKKGIILKEENLDKRYPEAEQVRWKLTTAGAAPVSGIAPLKWSRFRGKVRFLDSANASDAYIDMHTIGFNSPGEIMIPIGPDGSFDELVPARIYRVMNINSTGYSYNAMERWAWDYDLTGDREDDFVIGRMELYSIRAFDIIGGPPTLFVTFRPSTLSRILAFDTDHDGLVKDKERDALGEALVKSCTAIGPELTKDNVKIWIDGTPQTVEQLTLVPEFNGNGRYQVQYIAQVYPTGGRLFGKAFEIKIEVESDEVLNGVKIRDFGQGSTGFYPQGYGLSLF